MWLLKSGSPSDTTMSIISHIHEVPLDMWLIGLCLMFVVTTLTILVADKFVKKGDDIHSEISTRIPKP